LIKTRQDVATSVNEPQNSLAPVTNNTNVWSIHDELVSSSTRYFDEPGVPVELGQFLSQPVIQRTDDSITYCIKQR